MNKRINIFIAGLALVLTFTLGYSLGQSNLSQLQGRFDTELLAEQEAEEYLSVAEVDYEWNAELQGMDVQFVVENASDRDSYAVGDFVVNMHMRVPNGEKTVNIIEKAMEHDERAIAPDSALELRAFIPGGAELARLVEENGFDMHSLEVDID